MALTLMLIGTAAHAADLVAPGGTAAVSKPDEGRGGAWVSAGAGCLGGAAMGIVVPGLGNLIGCLIGGATAVAVRSATADDPVATPTP
jgi:hypothetical protein